MVENSRKMWEKIYSILFLMSILYVDFRKENHRQQQQQQQILFTNIISFPKNIRKEINKISVRKKISGTLWVHGFGV